MKTLEEKQTASKWFLPSANWFVLFVQTYEERRVAERLQSKLDPEIYKVFVPTKDYAFRKNGLTTVRIVPWIGGYVFIVTTKSSDECFSTIDPIVRVDSTIYKFLSNDGSGSILLSERDKGLMATMLDEDFNIPAFKAVMVGDQVKIIDGVFESTGGKVKRVNKRRQTAVVELELGGRLVECELMIDIVATVREEFFGF